MDLLIAALNTVILAYQSEQGDALSLEYATAIQK
jgi:hypothetical protein